MSQTQVQMSPVEVAFLFVPQDEISIQPLDEQKEIKLGDKVATNLDSDMAIGSVLWQGNNDLCWVTEMTTDGSSWQIRVVRVCEMVKVAPLQYAEVLGMAKLRHQIHSEDIGTRLQHTTATVAKLNKMGSPKNWCEKCEVPLTMVIKREVVTAFGVIDKSNKEKIKIGDPEDIDDKVVKATLYCPMCEKQTELSWGAVEVIHGD